MYTEDQYLAAAEAMELSAAKLLAHALLMRHNVAINRNGISLDKDVTDWAFETMKEHMDIEGAVVDAINEILEE